jgi:hypothetical protein
VSSAAVRNTTPHHLLVTVVSILVGFAVAAAINTHVAGMSFLEIVTVVLVVAAVVLRAYLAITRSR